MSVPPLSSVPSPLRSMPDAVRADARTRGGGGGRGWKGRTQAAPYLFLTPYFLISLLFFVYPLIYATVLAFYQTNGPARRAFVGMANFRFIVTDPDFHKALWNTTVFAF